MLHDVISNLIIFSLVQISANLQSEAVSWTSFINIPASKNFRTIIHASKHTLAKHYSVTQASKPDSYFTKSISVNIYWQYDMFGAVSKGQ